MPASGSYFVDRRTAEAAVKMSLPMINEAMKMPAWAKAALFISSSWTRH
jgi:hypothetical protein